MKIKKNSKKVKNNFSYNSKTNPNFMNSFEITKIIKKNLTDIEY